MRADNENQGCEHVSDRCCAGLRVPDVVRFGVLAHSLRILGYPARFEPLQNQRLNRPAGVIEIGAQAPDPPIRSSRKYWINPLFVVHVPGFTYRQGRPRELKDGSVVSGLDNRPKSELLIVGGAPAPTGAVKGVIGASNSSCGSAVDGTVVVVQVVPALAKYTNACSTADVGQSAPLQ